MVSRIQLLRFMTVIALLFFLFPLLKPSVSASGTEIPIDERIKTLLTAVTYHKSKATSEPGSFVIAIVHEKDVPADLILAVKRAFKKNKKAKVGKKRITTVVIVFKDKDSFKKEIEQKGADAVYITAGSRSVTRQILNVTRSVKILSITGVADYVHWLGASLGVESRSGKPKLLINLSGCKNEGVEFDARLLRLASVYF